MKIVSRNCRGLGNRPAVHSLLDLRKKEDPDILFLCETKLDEKRMEKFRYMLEMPHMIVKDSDGQGGGLALFWKRDIVVTLRWKGRMHIDVIIKEKDGFKWRLTGIYGEPRSEHRENTWKLLRTLHLQEQLPWLCVGDFNEILYNHEKQGGVPRPQRCLDAFRDALNFCNLNDLGFEGDVFTWRNNNFRVDGYIREHLDRVVANPSWRSRFPGYKIVNGDPGHSDHRPVVVYVHGTVNRRRHGNFTENRRFEAKWLLEDECETVVNSAWENACNRGETKVMGLLKSVSRELHDWDREVVGDLKKRIKNLKNDLEVCRNQGLTQQNIDREQVLRFKLECLEEQHDLF
ncbi:hypothetical protein ZWY2020_009184 [Hordeum vulgare]|nr:hypothetical protein ZWY2020_009184 [Hordeum vulgare]